MNTHTHTHTHTNKEFIILMLFGLCFLDIFLLNYILITIKVIYIYKA